MTKIKTGSIVVNPTNLSQGSVQDQIEDRSSYLRGDDNITWTGLQLEFTSDIILELINTADGNVKQFTIAAAQSPIALNNNESAYISIDRTTSGAATVVKSDTTAIPVHSNNNKDIFVLFRRKDTVSGDKIIHIPLHKQALSQGQSVKLGASGGGGGVGSLDTFYSEDFEGAIGSADFTKGNNATFDNGGTVDGVLSDDTSTQIAGGKSLKYVMGSSSVNDWIKSPNIAIDNKQSGNDVGLEFYYTYDGDDDDLKVVGYDDTGNEVMTLSTDYLKATSNPKRFSVQFPIPSTSTSLNWGLQVVTGNNTKILIVDDVQISTNPYVAKQLLDTESAGKINTNATTAIVDATTTYIGFATTGFDDHNHFVNVGSANNTAHASTTYFLVSKSGLHRVNSQLYTTDTAIDSGEQLRMEVHVNGVLVNRMITQPNATAATPRHSLAINDLYDFSLNDKVSIAFFNESGSVVALNATGGASWFSVKREATASDHIIAYNSRNASNLVVEGEGNGGTSITADVTDIDFTEVTDIGLGGSNWSGTIFTAKEDGQYKIDGCVDITSTAVMVISLYVGGTKKKAIGLTATASGLCPFSGYITLNKNDQLSIRSSASVTLQNTTTDHHIMIFKIGVGDLLGVPIPRTCYIKDVKSNGTAGGDFTLGAWKTRDLNDLTGDTEFVTLSSNQFTLEAGKYQIEGQAPAHKVSTHKVKLRNITDSTDDIIGSNAYNTGIETTNTSVLTGVVEITSTKTFELQHYGLVTRLADGFGNATTFGVSEIFSQMKITKIA